MHTAQDIITTYSRTGTRLREGFFKARASLLQQAALHMARSLARDGRILILGEGAADSCARTAARAFLDRLDLDRPALPAILIPAGDLREQGADRAALRQLEALARTGDTLLSFLPDPARTTMGPVLALAQETGLSCIALCG
uniref:SIS domain-containing protein n=1 Tax=uncultured Desulfovibrio sp. TaxID=167968 RepID=UPI00265CB169